MPQGKTNTGYDGIDRRSYILGMMTAFAECVANECKKVALSPPFYPDDYDTVLHGAERIAREQGIVLWYEQNLDIPEPRRLNWFVMVKFSDVLDEYRRLRAAGYNPAWHFDKFSDLLSYGTAWGQGAESVVPSLRAPAETIDTYAIVLLKPGDWPIPKKDTI
ncbi:MAG: hypothetical protein B6I22_11835 [Desulfobacteraceae bacterium 4572_123]|nr:MAG: hypothetical protein B6I22_11835 [Desulfobacteraceae bacterium 4572_123]